MPDNSSKSAVVECPCKVIPLFYSTRTVANLGMEFLLRATLRGFFSPALQAPTPAPFHPERRVRDPIGPFCARQGAANLSSSWGSTCTWNKESCQVLEGCSLVCSSALWELLDSLNHKSNHCLYVILHLLYCLSQLLPSEDPFYELVFTTPCFRVFY